MDISSIISAKGTNFLDPSTSSRPVGKKSLDVDDFLKLLTVQFTSQDPMKPMEDTQFISQMASFTSLEQMQTLNKEFSDFSKTQGITTANSYLGKKVTLTDAIAPTGTSSGIVTGISVDATNGPMLTVNGRNYELAKVQAVTLAPETTANH